MAQQQQFNQPGPQANTGYTMPAGSSLGTSQTQPGMQGNLGNAGIQKFPVAHFGIVTDATKVCVGWMTIEDGVIRYRAVQGTDGGHSFDFPFASIKEVKKNALYLSALQSFHVRTSNNENYNFSLVDVSSSRFLNPDSLLVAVHGALGK
jgi:hypothetical protein